MLAYCMLIGRLDLVFLFVLFFDVALDIAAFPFGMFRGTRIRAASRRFNPYKHLQSTLPSPNRNWIRIK